MSRENLDVLRHGHAAFNRGDLSGIKDMVVEDVEWGTLATFPGVDAVYRGRDGVAEWTADTRSAWDNYEVSVVNVLYDAGDQMVVEEHLQGRGLGSGVEVEMRLFAAYRFRDRKIAKRQAYMEKAKALEAAGLRD
jgi:ketosteroid isomerase-like protein